MHTTSRVPSSRLSLLCFLVILGVLCAWVLSLPVFPTQDGPMHRYYVHALDSLLQHHGTYNVYRIRHPFPPYATQYGSLIALHRLVSYDMAEKLYTCLVLICLAVGLRFTAEGVGPAGRWVSLLFAPVLFSWPLLMGFYNYTLGIGLFMLCMGFWQRLPRRQGWRHLVGFVLVLLLMAVTHPIPMILLIAFCGFDLLLSAVLRPRDTSVSHWFAQRRLQPVALLLTFLVLCYPLLAVDSSKTQHTLSLIRFNREFFTTSLLLTGISPYNSRSLDPWIDGYRLCLYAILVGAVWAGAGAARNAIRERRPSLGLTALIGTVVLAPSVCFLPNEVNGSWYFSTRLIPVLWIGALLAASAAPLATPFKQRLLALAGVVACIFTLAPAQKFLRPAALAVHAAEQIPVPTGAPGALLLGVDWSEELRFHDQLAFDPYKWGGVLPFVREDLVALDTPWLDQKISPLEAIPDGPELTADISRRSRDPIDAPAVRGRSLPALDEARIVRESSFVVLTAPASELRQGLAEQLTPAEQAKYSCRQVQPRYLVCTSIAR